MARGKRCQPKQVVNLLRQIEVAVANGKMTAQTCKKAEIVEQTHFRPRRRDAIHALESKRADGRHPP